MPCRDSCCSPFLPPDDKRALLPSMMGHSRASLHNVVLNMHRMMNLKYVQRGLLLWSDVEMLAEVKATETVGPVLIHVVTEKGRGYLPAETAADKMHGVVKYDPITGQQKKSSGGVSCYTLPLLQASIERFSILLQILGFLSVDIRDCTVKIASLSAAFITILVNFAHAVL